MLQYSEHEDVIVMDSTAKSLASKLQGIFPSSGPRRCSTDAEFMRPRTSTLFAGLLHDAPKELILSFHVCNQGFLSLEEILGKGRIPQCRSYCLSCKVCPWNGPQQCRELAVPVNNLLCLGCRGAWEGENKHSPAQQSHAGGARHLAQMAPPIRPGPLAQTGAGTSQILLLPFSTTLMTEPDAECCHDHGFWTV